MAASHGASQRRLIKGAVMLPPDSADPDFLGALGSLGSLDSLDSLGAAVPVGPLRSSSSRFRYARERAWAALRPAPPAPDGSRLLRYVNADSQGAVLPTLDGYLLVLARNQPTRRIRTTGNAVCVVAQGQGSSQVGSETMAWQHSDVFTLPH